MVVFLLTFEQLIRFSFPLSSAIGHQNHSTVIIFICINYHRPDYALGWSDVAPPDSGLVGSKIRFFFFFPWVLDCQIVELCTHLRSFLALLFSLCSSLPPHYSSYKQPQQEMPIQPDPETKQKSNRIAKKQQQKAKGLLGLDQGERRRERPNWGK